MLCSHEPVTVLWLHVFKSKTRNTVSGMLPLVSGGPL
jgi:hypothetical protein